MRSDSVYAQAMRRTSRPLRCLTCWGRTVALENRAMFECENGHQIAMIAYEEWRSQSPRTTGRVIGPSQRGLRTIDLGELAYMALARERRQVFEEWRTTRSYATVQRPDMLLVQLIDALVDEVVALRDRLGFLEGGTAS